MAKKASPKGHKRYRQQGKQLEMLARMKEVSDLYLQGWSLSRISAKLDVSHVTVKNDLDRLRVEWLASSLVNMDERKAQELAKIDLLEEMAHSAWAKSCADQVDKKRGVHSQIVPTKEVDESTGKSTYVNKMTPTKIIKENVSKSTSGNPKFLDQIAWCIETRLKIFGLIKPDSTINNNTVNVLPQGFWDQLIGVEDTLDPIEARIANPIETTYTETPTE